MLKKQITYTDYEGEERTEEFYFNMTKAELLKMEMSAEGGLKHMLEKLIKERDGKKLVEVFEDLILSAYGEKSTDGRRFIKSKELSDNFKQTEAYSELFMELSTNADAAADFVNAIAPQVKA